MSSAEILEKMKKFATIQAMMKKMGNIRFKLYDTFGFVCSYPSTIMIEPTNFCNLRCPACPTGNGKMNRPGRIMGYDEFARIIDQCKGHVKNLTLWNFGEPFLNKDIIAMIDYAHKAGMNVTTSTNGHFFKSKEFCTQLVNSGLQRLIICLDGADQDTISKYRKNANFNDILDGLKLIVSTKKDLKSEKPIIELQFILMRHNEHQRYYMREFARDLGVDIYAEKTVGIGPNNGEIEFQNLAKELLPKDISLSRYFMRPNGTFIPKGNIVNSCMFICQTMVINSDGSVIPCCYDEMSKYMMGNIFEEDIRSIWKNDKYQSLRRKIRKNRKDISLCSRCSESRYITKDDI